MRALTVPQGKFCHVSLVCFGDLSLVYAEKGHNDTVIYQVSKFCYKMERKGLLQLELLLLNFFEN